MAQAHATMAAADYASSGQKVLPLEALRGLAAVSVALYHFILAFLPDVLHFSHKSLVFEGSLASTPLLALANGTAMVMVFFVLSGYVLSLKGLQPNAGRVIAETALKRWFRLTPLILISLLISYALFRFNLYHFTEASEAGHSSWLKNTRLMRKPSIM